VLFQMCGGGQDSPNGPGRPARPRYPPFGHAGRFVQMEFAGRRRPFLAGWAARSCRRSARWFLARDRWPQIRTSSLADGDMSRTRVEQLRSAFRCRGRPYSKRRGTGCGTCAGGPGADFDLRPARRCSRLALGRRHPAERVIGGRRFANGGGGAWRRQGHRVALSQAAIYNEHGGAGRSRWTWPNRPSSSLGYHAGTRQFYIAYDFGWRPETERFPALPTSASSSSGSIPVGVFRAAFES